MIRKHVGLSNRGSALPAVLLVMVIVMSLATVVIRLSTQQVKEETYYENDTGALHAAEAGLNKYLWYLNKKDSTIDMDTVITYPEDNPVAAYKLTCTKNEGSLKQVISTGWMLNDPAVTQTVKAKFVKRSFAQYIYLTNFEQDNIFWMSGENCYGPLHTNGVLHINGDPTFWSTCTSPNQYTQVDGSNPTFKVDFQRIPAVGFPKDNKELMIYAKTPKGYYYEGRTSILLNGNGTITVWNPNHNPTLETRPLPENGVIYVNEMGGANYSNKFYQKNGNVFISGTLDGKLTVGAFHDIYITGYDPTKNTFSSATATKGIVYQDTKFDLDETLGKAIVKENPTDGSEADMLGLIAVNDVAVLTEGWFNNSTVNSSIKPFTINAAMLAVNGSFRNSAYNKYPHSAGELIVRGSIAQKTRGAVGTQNQNGTFGYSKNYAHDERMLNDDPPYFLDPEASGWEITEWN